VSDQTRAAILDALSRQDPRLRSQMDSALNGNQVQKVLDRFMIAHGFLSRNMADDLAMQLLMSWEIVTGASATAQQIRGVDLQVRQVILEYSAVACHDERGAPADGGEHCLPGRHRLGGESAVSVSAIRCRSPVCARRHRRSCAIGA
jgi:hypothetical protein